MLNISSGVKSAKLIGYRGKHSVRFKKKSFTYNQTRECNRIQRNLLVAVELFDAHVRELQGRRDRTAFVCQYLTKLRKHFPMLKTSLISMRYFSTTFKSFGSMRSPTFIGMQL